MPSDRVCLFVCTNDRRTGTEDDAFMLSVSLSHTHSFTERGISRDRRLENKEDVIRDSTGVVTDSTGQIISMFLISQNGI